MNYIRVQRHIRIKKGLIIVIWEWNCTLGLKWAWLEWFECRKANEIWRAFDLSSLRVHMHIRIEEGHIQRCKGAFERRSIHLHSQKHDLSGSRVQKHIWDQNGSIELKMILFEWIKGTKIFLREKCQFKIQSITFKWIEYAHSIGKNWRCTKTHSIGKNWLKWIKCSKAHLNSRGSNLSALRCKGLI